MGCDALRPGSLAQWVDFLASQPLPVLKGHLTTDYLHVCLEEQLRGRQLGLGQLFLISSDPNKTVSAFLNLTI